MVMNFEQLGPMVIDNMPFKPDEDIYIKFDSMQEAKETALWMIAQGVTYIGLNEDRIYISNDNFQKIAKIMKVQVEGD